MSACTRYPDDEVVLRYVTSDLAEPELAAFEDHMFACDACLARVERYQMAQQSFAVRDLPAPPVVVGGTAHRQTAPSKPLVWWVLGAIAATVIAALAGLSPWLRPSDDETVHVAAQPAPVSPAAAAQAASAARPSTSALRVAVLAMVTPPPYLSLTTRAAGDSSFAVAMQAYSRADWLAASRALATLDAPDARFYKGIADLMRGDTAAAVEALQAARASAQQPYARESVFYLGKAALQRGDVAAAQTLFAEARDAKAGPDDEAARLLTELADADR
jgi:hypothetical protein